MPDRFRFPAAPNRAHEIRWREWDEAAFAEAAAADRPMLLNLTASWSQWCRGMDAGTWSDDAVIALLNEEFVPVRVDADRYPHVQDRYIAGGWPTNAFLTPTGEVLWAGTWVEKEELLSVAAGVLQAWGSRREELMEEISRRHRAMESSRGRTSERALVRREPADDVLAATCDVFDPRNGGFGDAPKFPHPDAVELLYAQARHDPGMASMADRTLDGMLAGELRDADGGFFRYATAADWTEPRREKLLEPNAALLDAYSLGAWVRGREDWREVAAGIVAWAEETLALPSGLWAGSLDADEEYFAGSAADRAVAPAPAADVTINTAWNARWIAALAAAGARLGEAAWVERAASSLDVLFSTMTAPGGGLWHFQPADGEPRVDFLLADTLQGARAALTVAQATGEARWLEHARGLVRRMESAFASDGGGFWDRLPSAHDVGSLRYRDRPFEGNALAARVLLDFAHVTGERARRAHAERTLARIGHAAGRYGPDGAVFALATTEFFDAPTTVVIAVPEGCTPADAAALRTAAWQIRLPGLRVWTVPAGHRAGPVVFEASGAPAAWVWTRRGCAGPFTGGSEMAVAAVSADAAEAAARHA